MNMERAVTWPNGARCAVALTFDLDGESPDPPRSRAGRAAAAHGHALRPKTGTPRILRILERYDLKAGWFIPGWIIERYPDLCREIVRRGHEVGHHGYLHEKPFFLSGAEEEEALLVKTLDVFRKVLDVRPRGSRAPPAIPASTPWSC